MQLEPSSTKFDSANKAKIGKSLRDIEKVLSTAGKGAWPNNSVSALERALGEINRALEKGHEGDKAGFHCLGGFAILSRLFGLFFDQSSVIPLKSISLCTKTWKLACTRHAANTRHVLKSNMLTPIVDILHERLQGVIPASKLVTDCLSTKCVL